MKFAEMRKAGSEWSKNGRSVGVRFFGLSSEVMRFRSGDAA